MNQRTGHLCLSQVSKRRQNLRTVHSTGSAEHRSPPEVAGELLKYADTGALLLQIETKSLERWGPDAHSSLELNPDLPCGWHTL